MNKNAEHFKQQRAKNPVKTALSALAALVLGCALWCQPSQAVPITGTLAMGGAVTLDNANLGLATEATAFPFSVVTSGTDSFGGTAFSFVSWTTPFSWNPPNTPISDLWKFTSGGRTYSFELDSVSILSQSSSFLNLSGMGVLAITGSGPVYDDTPGNFTFAITSSGPNSTMTLGFAASNSAVPDGGLTLSFLGLAMVGIEGLRRKLKK
jgi:hypothetical protein